MKLTAHFLLAGLLGGCMVASKAPGTPDAALMLSVTDQRLVLASLNSAHQTQITKQSQSADTLSIWYKTGAWVRPANALRLDSSVNYVRCGQHLYRVLRTEQGIKMEQI